MKKIITSVLAFSLTAVLFTGCGQTDNSNGNAAVEVGTSESETVNETTQESFTSTTASETTTAKTTETVAVSGKETDLSDDYEDVLRAFYDATNSGDYEALFKTTYPAKIVEGMLGLMDREPDAFENEMEKSSSTYEITDIIEEGTMDQSDLDVNVMVLNNIAGGLDTLREHGGDPEALSDEEREKVADAIMGIVNPDAADIPDYYSSSKGYDVTVRYNKDGKRDEDYFFVFYVDGEGWKVNNSMRKFAKKTKNVSLNNAAKNIYNAFNVALDAEYGSIPLNDLFIIGSDESINYNVPSTVNTAEILKSAEKYFDEIDYYDYFIIVNNGSCIYSVADKKDDDDDTIGTRPIDEIPVSLSTVDGTKFETVESVSGDYYSFEELFEAAKKAIK